MTELIYPSSENPAQDLAGKAPVEIIEFNEAGLVVRSLHSNRVWGIAVNVSPEDEEIDVTELEQISPENNS